MLSFEDLRGRHFRWSETDEVPSRVLLVEDPIEVGQIVRVPDFRPTFFADFAGLRLRIDHSISVLGPTFEVRDTETAEPIVKSHYSRDTELSAHIDKRIYRLRRSGSVAVWNDGTDDAVSLRTNEGFVLTGADARDAAPLLLLGIVMALENTLFPAR